MNFDINSYLKNMNISYMSRSKDIKSIADEFKNIVLKELNIDNLDEILKDANSQLKSSNNFSIIEEKETNIPLSSIKSTTSSFYSKKTFKDLIETKISSQSSSFRDFLSNYEEIINEEQIGNKPCILYCINNDTEYIIEDGNSRIFFAKLIDKFCKKPLILKEAKIINITINHDLLKKIELTKETVKSLNCNLQVVKQTFERDDKKCRLIKSITLTDSKGNIIDNFEPNYFLENGINPVSISFAERSIIKYCDKVEELIKYYKLINLAKMIGLLTLIILGSVSFIS